MNHNPYKWSYASGHDGSNAVCLYVCAFIVKKNQLDGLMQISIVP